MTEVKFSTEERLDLNAGHDAEQLVVAASVPQHRESFILFKGEVFEVDGGERGQRSVQSVGVLSASPLIACRLPKIFELTVELNTRSIKSRSKVWGLGTEHGMD